MRRIKQHTVQKLEYFRKYLIAYLHATKRLPQKYYVDAFAGTGKCILCNEKCKSRGGKKCDNCTNGKKRIVNGSALISLRIEDNFDAYVFIELDQNNLKNLDSFLKQEFSEEKVKKVKLICGDSNLKLQEIAQKIPAYTGCLIFLDPEGSELYWDTVAALSKIKRVDLLILYPYDMGLVRLTKTYKEKLDKFYGTTEWLKIYQTGMKASERKEKLLTLYKERLREIGFKYSEPKQIRQELRRGHPLYHLIFVSHNDTAIKIMNKIFDKELDGQQKMKLL